MNHLVVRLLPEVPVPDVLLPDVLEGEVPVPEVPAPDVAVPVLLLLLLPGRDEVELLVPGDDVPLREVPAPVVESVALLLEPLSPLMPLGTGTVRPSRVIICPLGNEVVSTRVARPL